VDEQISPKTMTPAPKRRWFRFSLRTLFVVVTTFVVISAFVWWVEWNMAQVRHREQMLTKPPIFRTQFLVAIQYSRQRQPPFLWRLLGAHGVRQILLSNFATADDTKLVQRLFPEAIVGVSNGGASETVVMKMVD
jgi:hypothetical protein